MRMPQRRATDRKLLASYGRRTGDNKWPRHGRDLWMLAVTILVLLALHFQNDTLSTLAGQHVSLVEACNRLQILRIEANIGNYSDYRVDLFVLRASEHPLQAQTREQRKFTLGFLLPLRQAVNAKSWTPRTDCQEAVNERGVHYRPPAPIPFARQLPPRNALSLDPSDFQ